MDGPGIAERPNLAQQSVVRGARATDADHAVAQLGDPAGQCGRGDAEGGRELAGRGGAGVEEVAGQASGARAGLATTLGRR